MPLSRSFIALFSAIFLLLASPLYIFAQPSTRDRLQPDFSAGFQLPNREPGLPKDNGEKKALSNWRQYKTGTTTNSGWASGMNQKAGEGSTILRLKQRDDQGGSTVLRRWRLEGDAQDSGMAKPGEEGISAGEQTPARVPADLRGGFGAVLKGRPVAPPEQP